uniref:Glycosyl transferase 64 domain-containing protein n=1 Tax=Chaetoceros debilis TaxID=122233 RepID=A0A7S3VFB4_9STRA
MKIHLLVAALLATIISSGTSAASTGGVNNANTEQSNEDPLGLRQLPQDESFAACILIMDDNHRLIEWLAYHYHTMPLRRVIVMIDPRSKTSPLPVLNRWEKYMKMDLWSDNDLFTVEELKDRADKEMIKNHRSRQRAFNVKCLTTLKEEGAKWTLMTDVDEYTRINPRALDSSEGIYQTDIAPMQLSEPGSILKMLNKGVDLNDERLHAQEWKACIPVSRVQLSGTESSDEEVNNKFPKELEPTILAKDFDTFRWRYSGVDTITAKDGVLPGKTFIDVSSIPDSEMWRLIGDPHRPIDKLCKGGNVWLNTNETMFVADHILGTLESYSLRDDSRFFDRVLTWQQRKEVGGLTDLHDELRPWLSGFIDTMGIGESRRLLANVGQLQAQTHALPRCSINFFGLPRSFKSMALPSIVKNILLPNARYNCDIVVHYYNMQFDEGGRFNRGGEIDADAVQALKEVSKVIAANAGKSPPSVIIKSETKEEFEEKYGDLVKKYKTAKDVDTGKPKYFPWKETSYSVKTNVIDNIAMQWNSIQSAWQLMEEHSKVHGFEYERVAFFRTDSFYALPVDIFQVDKDTFDYNNRYAVIPAFARYPVNDRMMYGPYEAVKIWATERFQRIDHYIESSEIKGYGMHQERYIANGILPAIREETGYEVVENIDICFYRTRAADSVIISDCSDPIGGSARGIQEIDQVQLVQNLVDRDCLEFPTGDRFVELRCPEEEEEEEEEDKEEVQDEEEAQDEEEVRQKHDEEEAQGKQGEEDDEDEEEEQEKQEKRGEVEGNLVVSKIK